MNRPRIVVLGMLTKIPVAGVVWQYLHYLIGLQRLGVDVYYVEAHARAPSSFMTTPDDDGTGRAAAFIDAVCRRAGLDGKWAYHALHEQHAPCLGMSRSSLYDLYAHADALINMHGGTRPLDEHAATGRLVYLETDPCELQIELSEERVDTMEFLDAHGVFFTFAENYGHPGCALPVTRRYEFNPTRQPVLIDEWRTDSQPSRDVLTTIGNWHQPWRNVQVNGEVLTWSKDAQFRRFLDVAARTAQPIELALGAIGEDDRAMLRAAGWLVADPAPLSAEPDLYRSYIQSSMGEFTVAKEQNVRLQSGWFSDRTATYLAAGRPVVVQDTGCASALPTGAGILTFEDVDGAVAAVESVRSDFARHATAARIVAEEFFAADRVLGPFLDRLGLQPPRRHRPAVPAADLDLTVRSRYPTRLSVDAETYALMRPLPAARTDTLAPVATLVVPVWNGLPFVRLCLESALESDDGSSIEVLVVDNGSDADTAGYLDALETAHDNVRVLRHACNLGFPAGVNAGVAASRTSAVVIANSDVLFPPRWLGALTTALKGDGIGLVGAVTNRAGTEAEVETDYCSYGQFEAAADRRARDAVAVRDVEVVELICAAIDRDFFEMIGGLDTGYGLGLFEDDELSRRVHAAGRRTVLAESVLVHHFGQGTIGAMPHRGELFAANRARYEARWGPWHGHRRRAHPCYDTAVLRLIAAIEAAVPVGSAIAVISHGDERLLQLNGLVAGHLPANRDGTYAGRHPANTAEAIEHIEGARRHGARFLVLPRASHWWLDTYDGLALYLSCHARPVVTDEETGMIYEFIGGARPA